MKLIFYVGDHAAKRATGGLGMIVRFAQLCRAQGIPALLLGSPDAPGTLEFGLPPAVFIGPADVQAGDVVLFPEPDRRPLRQFGADVRKWILCQNHFYIFNQWETEPLWEEQGVDGVVCTSQAIERSVRAMFPSLAVAHVPCFVDLPPPPPPDRTIDIAYMPRKLPREAGFIRGALGRLYEEYRELRWHEIHGVSHDEALRQMSRASIFLSLGTLEGLGLPPLEAMAAGAVVVGFHGFGGAEYAHPGNGFWCDAGGPEAAVHALAQALRLQRTRPAAFAGYVEQGYRTAHHYRRELTEAALQDFWRAIGGTPPPRDRLFTRLRRRLSGGPRDRLPSP